MMNYLKRAFSVTVAFLLCFQQGSPNNNTNRYLPILERQDSYFTQKTFGFSSSSLYFMASTAHARNGNKAGIGELEGRYDLKDVINSYAAIAPASDPIFAVTGRRDLAGKSLPFGVTGRLEGVGCILKGDWAFSKQGFSVGVHLPVLAMRRVTRFNFNSADFGFGMTAQQLNDATRIIDRVRRYTHDQIGFTSNLWSETGLGDLDMHVRWQKAFDHVLLTRTIKTALQGSIIVPTGVTVDAAKPGSIAFGTDGHFGICADWTTSVELKQDLTVGLQFGATHLFPKTKTARLSVGNEPALFSALVGRVQEHQGNCLRISPSVTLGNLSDGLDFQARYTYVRHAQNSLRDMRQDQSIQSYLQKATDLIIRKHDLSKWRAHYFSFNATYDCAVAAEKIKFAPRFFISYDMPIDGSAFMKMHTIQLGAELHF